MRASDRHPREWAEYMLVEFRELNRITLDELHAAIVGAGFSVRQVELISTEPTFQRAWTTCR